MAGHSKWSKIKRQKGSADALRSKIFTKIGREIAVAVKSGGSDPHSNARLAQIIAKAKANNMPNDNIARGIKKASGELGNINYEEVVYEGYGPNGIAFVVEGLTDNKNRTAAEVRAIFSKNGGSLGVAGCAAISFEKKSVFFIEKCSFNEDDMMEIVLDCGADDFNENEDGYQIFAAAIDFNKVLDKLTAKNMVFIKSGIERVAVNLVDIDDEDTVKKLYKMLDSFDDNDDVQAAFHNARI
ncbi:MAG: YebC/PmpR family DNA-binding transcriptional regulator [Firmicutes bacterium]|nr:YebC/PmpR family DNA-binding transcriptional regulator [Bacillota bacterium]